MDAGCGSSAYDKCDPIPPQPHWGLLEAFLLSQGPSHFPLSLPPVICPPASLRSTLFSSMDTRRVFKSLDLIMLSTPASPSMAAHGPQYNVLTPYGMGAPKSSPSHHPFLFLCCQPSPLGGSSLVSGPRDGGCASQGPQCVAPCERLCGGPSPPTTHPTVTTPDLPSTYYVLGAKNGAIMKTLLVLAQRRHILVPPPYFPTDPQTLPLCFFRSLLQCHCLCAAHPSPNSLPSPPLSLSLSVSPTRMHPLGRAVSDCLLYSLLFPTPRTVPGTREICADYRGAI